MWSFLLSRVQPLVSNSSLPLCRELDIRRRRTAPGWLWVLCQCATSSGNNSGFMFFELFFILTVECTLLVIFQKVRRLLTFEKTHLNDNKYSTLSYFKYINKALKMNQHLLRASCSSISVHRMKGGMYA